MPIYEYRRPDGTTFEVMQSFSDPPLSVDPDTGARVERVLHAPALHFKGNGFYNTDYGTRNRQRETAAAAEESAAEGSSDSSSSSSSSPSSSSGDAGSASAPVAGGAAGKSDNGSKRAPERDTPKRAAAPGRRTHPAQRR
jgi:putative FmdB family regulatory protein